MTSHWRDTPAILRDQLAHTLALLHHVQRTEAHFGDRSSVVLELLGNVSIELSAAAESIRHCGVPGGAERAETASVEAASHGSEGGNLESLLNAFCRYARQTSERLAEARTAGDQEAIVALDRILHMANRSIWFLDLYLNALCLKSSLSPLPKWKPAAPPPAKVEAKRVATFPAPL